MTRKVTVYFTTGWSSCHHAMEFLSQKGVRFTAKNIAEDSKAKEELTQQTGRMSVPVIVVNGEVVVGFDRERLVSLLGLS